MRCNSACTTAVKRSSARSSPPLQAFNNTVTSADPPGSMAAPEKILTRLWPLPHHLFACTRRGRKAIDPPGPMAAPKKTLTGFCPLPHHLSACTGGGRNAMKLFGAVAVMAAATGAWAGDGAQTSQRVVMACLNPGADASMMYRGQATAAQILKQAGVRLEWRGDESACAGGRGLVVTVSRATPVDQHPGALAY